MYEMKACIREEYHGSISYGKSILESWLWLENLQMAAAGIRERSSLAIDVVYTGH
jgi:hypothetical protein